MATIELTQTESRHYELRVDGEPFFIKGAGLEFGSMATLAACGGNALRTWRVDNGRKTGEQVLDEAHRLGLKVCMGLELARERHGFDYGDSTAVATQHRAIMADVERLKNHPALLMWGLGNELNLRARHPGMWDAVESLCQAIKACDPDHPVTTMLAGIDRPTVQQIARRAPSLDLLSFQLYGEIDRLSELLRDSGYQGPYQITEWGPTGHWESPETPWGRPIEPSSHQQAADISRRYHDVILSDPARCIGAYIFLWGQKQERTPTWYGLFLEDGRRLEAVDVMQTAWSGRRPAHSAPRIEGLYLDGQRAQDTVILAPGAAALAEVACVTPSDKNVDVYWQVRPEVPHELESDGGDFEPTPPSLIDLETTQETTFHFTAPEPGEYRLYCRIDGPGNVSAVANIPFLVAGNGDALFNAPDRRDAP